jgi:hypothetical protein
VSADPVLVVAWLVLGHLAGDFVFQTNRMVSDKTSTGSRATRGFLAHGAVVGVCLLPFAAAFGLRGVGLVVVIALAHVVIDRWKVRATRHAEAVALAEAHRRHEDTEPGAGLGPAWTPMPGALFLVDQAIHLIVAIGAWLILVAFVTPQSGFTAAVDSLLGPIDRASFHVATLLAVVTTSLLIVNVRAAALFVATLVHPREAVTGEPAADEGSTPAPATPAPATPSATASAPSRERRWWQIRLGPFVAKTEPAPGPTTTAAPPASRPAKGARSFASPARIGATIGVLERLLIVTLVLTNATAAIGLVLGAKTLARFKQLDDRDFAEYYLLGTLASVAIALGSALVADAALATVGL